MSTVLRMSQQSPDTVRFFSASATAVRGSVQSFSSGPLVATFKEGDNGTREYEPMRVFKSGTFKDSMGFQTTWEKEHLAQMVFNFNMLRDRGIFHDIPVRDGHPSLFGGVSISGRQAGRIVGYVLDLDTEEADGTTFLTASFSILNEEDQKYMDNGSFRARSSEVGFFESNDEALYWPVFQGFAFVDIGAVEGLYEKEKAFTQKGATDFAILIEKEAPVGTKVDDKKEEQAPPATQDATTPPVNTTPETPPTPQPELQTQAHAQSQQTHTFRVNGQPTTDFGAVQTHIDALESAMKDMRDDERKSYVKALVDGNKVPATATDDLEKLVLSMTDEQYAMHRKTYESAQSMPLLGNHSTGSDGGSPPVNNEDSKVEVDLGIVEQFKKSGKTAEWIKGRPAYKRLEAAGKAPTL